MILFLSTAIGPGGAPIAGTCARGETHASTPGGHAPPDRTQPSQWAWGGQDGESHDGTRDYTRFAPSRRSPPKGGYCAAGGASAGAGGFRIWSTIRVSYLPATNRGSCRTRLWKGMLVLIPSI